MTERDPNAIASHCREAVLRDDLSAHHREMLRGYARFYEVLADQMAKEPHHRSRREALGLRSKRQA